MISKFLPEIGRAETIHLVRKSSNFEPSSRFFGRLKIWTFGRTSSEVEIEDVIFSNMPLMQRCLCLSKYLSYESNELSQKIILRNFLSRYDCFGSLNERFSPETRVLAAETIGSVPFVLVPALVLTWHHVKIKMNSDRPNSNIIQS